MINVFLQNKNDPSQLGMVKEGNLVDLTGNQDITLCVVEPRLASDQPNVLIVSTDGDSTFVMQASLDQLVTGVSQLAERAALRWGWPQPKGIGKFDNTAKTDLAFQIKVLIDGFEP
jgi:hypothetical protein